MKIQESRVHYFSEATVLKEKCLPVNAWIISALIYYPTNSNISLVLSGGVADCFCFCLLAVPYDVRRLQIARNAKG